MPERHGLIDTIAEQITPVHADGYKFLALGAGISLLFFLLWPPLGWLGALATAWIAYFFRDPARVTPLRQGLIIAPGDGKICALERVRPPGELGFGDAERLRVSIFLSVFDVHINRAGQNAARIKLPYSQQQLVPRDGSPAVGGQISQ